LIFSNQPKAPHSLFVPILPSFFSSSLFKPIETGIGCRIIFLSRRTAPSSFPDHAKDQHHECLALHADVGSRFPLPATAFSAYFPTLRSRKLQFFALFDVRRARSSALYRQPFHPRWRPLVQRGLRVNISMRDGPSPLRIPFNPPGRQLNNRSPPP